MAQHRCVAVIANRDREQIDELKATFAQSGASVVELPADGTLDVEQLARGRIDLVLLKLTTDPANEKTFAALRGRDLRYLNTLDSVDRCQSRRATFAYLRRHVRVAIPRWFETTSEARGAVADGTTLWVRRDAHNIPLDQRVLGIARTTEALDGLVDGHDPRTLFFQEYLEGAGDTFKAFVVDDHVAVGLRAEVDKRFVFEETAMPARVVDAIREIGRGFGMSVYGVDFFCRGSDAVFLDFNDFPSFRGVAGASGRIAAFAARMYF